MINTGTTIVRFLMVFLLQHTQNRGSTAMQLKLDELIRVNRDFVEAMIWKVPAPVPPTTHGFKYRLAYIVDGVRVVGFDNERGKGDHRHDDGVEFPYQFTDVDQLRSDFLDAVTLWRTRHSKV